MKWYKSIRIRVIIVLLIMVFVMMSITSAIVISKTRVIIEERIFQSNMSVALALQESFDLYFSELKSSMEALSYTEEICCFEFDRIDPLLQRVV